MVDIGLLHDRYLESFSGEKEDQQIVSEQCCWCDGELLKGEEVVKDTEGNYFCDEECAGSYHGFKEIMLEGED